MMNKHVRSVFLPYGAALKWLGFWFMVGTVMIARYGKVSGAENRQGLYTVLLAGAMALVLFLHPGERSERGEHGGQLIDLRFQRR